MNESIKPPHHIPTITKPETKDQSINPPAKQPIRDEAGDIDSKPTDSPQKTILVQHQEDTAALSYVKNTGAAHNRLTNKRHNTKEVQKAKHKRDTKNSTQKRYKRHNTKDKQKTQHEI